jgi:hypothetical protein
MNLDEFRVFIETQKKTSTLEAISKLTTKEKEIN